MRRGRGRRHRVGFLDRFGPGRRGRDGLVLVRPRQRRIDSKGTSLCNRGWGRRACSGATRRQDEAEGSDTARCVHHSFGHEACARRRSAAAMQELFHPARVGLQLRGELLRPFPAAQAEPALPFPIWCGRRWCGWSGRCVSCRASIGWCGNGRQGQAPVLCEQTIRPSRRRLFASQLTMDTPAEHANEAADKARKAR